MRYIVAHNDLIDEFAASPLELHLVADAYSNGKGLNPARPLLSPDSLVVPTKMDVDNYATDHGTALLPDHRYVGLGP